MGLTGSYGIKNLLTVEGMQVGHCSDQDWLVTVSGGISHCIIG